VIRERASDGFIGPTILGRRFDRDNKMGRVDFFHYFILCVRFGFDENLHFYFLEILEMAVTKRDLRRAALLALNNPRFFALSMA